MMRDEKPLFILLGMPRAGTTFLYHNLQKHPQIYVPFRRKTNYYAAHHQESRQWYYHHFSEAKPGQVWLDTDTLSFINDDSYARFKAGYEGEKVILVLRDPATWALSLYRQIASFTFQMPSFREYVEQGFTLVEDGVDIPFQFGPGDLKRKVEDIQRFFGKNLLLLDFDLIKQDPLQFVQSFEQFMGLEAHFEAGNFSTERINSGNKKSNKYLNALLRKQWLISTLRTVFPPKLVVWIRTKFDKASVNKKEIGEVRWDEADLAFAKEYYQEDTAYFRQLFATQPVHFGAPKPIKPSAS